MHESPWYQNEINTVPWIVGMVSNEGLMLVAGNVFRANFKLELYAENYYTYFQIRYCVLQVI